MSNARNLSKFKPSSSGLSETDDIADNAITTAKITDGNISTAKLADDAVTNAKVADNAVANAQLADNAVGTSEIADDAVTQAKIGADAVGTTELANDVAINTSGSITTTGAFTSPGIDDNADATAITIDSSENVGLGTTTPATSLEISGTSANTQGGAFPRIQITTTADNNPTYSGSLDIVEKQSSATSSAVFGTAHVYGFRTMLDGFNNVLSGLVVLKLLLLKEWV